MSRTLIFMRHAKQSGLAASDHERPLTPEGRDAALRVGESLRAESIVPAFVLSSTALRCRQTWDAVSAGLGASVEASFEASLYNAAPTDLADAIAGVDPDHETLLVLAHNPGISLFALELAAAVEQDVDALRSGFTPATTARFRVDGPWSELSARTARLERFDVA